MTVLLLTAVPVLAGAVLGLTASRVGRRLPPAAAVKLLAPTAFVTALTTGFSLSVLAFTALARIPVLAALGHWSVGALGVDDVPPPVGGAVVGTVVVSLLLAALRRSLRTATDLRHAILACRHLREAGDGLVLLDDDSADAFAVPGIRGRIVVTRGMLRALTPPERRALIAHERAHLSGHHQLYIQAADLAAAANPLLRPVAVQVRVLAERWADECAATLVGDRRLTARALAKAALARAAHRRAQTPSLALAASSHGVAGRVLALTRPAPRPSPRLAGFVVALGLAGVLASLWSAHATEATFEAAHAAYQHDVTPR